MSFVIAMDTPERNQIGTPISKFEESPFSNFINSLSPINPTKSIHVSQTFGSLSFASPPSVFTSPHVKDYKFFRSCRRHQVSYLDKSLFATDSTTREITNSDQQSDTLVRGEGASGGDELQRVLTSDNGGPHCEAGTSLALVPYVQDPSARNSFGTELNPQDMNHDNEEAGCDWQSLIACSSDLFIFDSPDVVSTSKGSLQKLQEESNVFDSLLSRFPPNDMQNSIHIGSNKYNEAQETIEQHSSQPMMETEIQQTDQASENQGISTNEFLSGDSGQEPGKEAFGKLHRGMRRRCLTFEMPRTKKNMEGVLFSRSLSTLQTEERQFSCNRQPVTPGADSSMCILPGIGLHLNALAAASKDCGIPSQGMVSPSTQDPLINSSASSSLRNDEDPAENVLDSADDSSQASLYASNEELNPNSPKKKRKKAETIGDGESCKRCNCKKSKCLKLYCECFAAGVYCVEPCSCQDCFNKPIHEDTVLATRKQIESRNPLAFAPKVIRTADSAPELGEDSNRTPASARHKRGCNCKKSNCLKKYCECYQGGVGCSINCRCEGCKNAFGRKDGFTLIATEPEMEKLQASEKSVMDKTSNTTGIHDDEDQYSEFVIPKTPSRFYRSSVPMAISSKGKPPRSSLGTHNSLSGLLTIDGGGRSTFLRAQSRIEKHHQNASIDEIPAVLQNMSPPSSGLKTLSPTSKRISPPHNGNGQAIVLRSSRKLILQSIPSFPSLSPRR